MYMFSSLRFNVLVLHLGKVYHFTIISVLMYPSCFLFFCYSIAILFGLKVLVFFLFHLLPSYLQLFIIVFQCLLKSYLDSISYIFTLPTSHFMPNVFHYMHQTCYIFEVGSGLSPGETWIMGLTCSSCLSSCTWTENHCLLYFVKFYGWSWWKDCSNIHYSIVAQC